DQGLPKARIEEAAARTQARIDTGQQIIVGVNKYKLDEPEAVPVLKIDNAKVRTLQLDKLSRLKAARKDADVNAALATLEAGARANGNLLDLAVNAARAKATVGEMSSALERAFQRHQPPIRLVTGVFAREAVNDLALARVREAIVAFKEAEGARP